jgi:hypothetical protein
MGHLDGEHGALKSFAIVSSATILCRLQTARANDSGSHVRRQISYQWPHFRGVQLDELSNFPEATE